MQIFNFSLFVSGTQENAKQSQLPISYPYYSTQAAYPQFFGQQQAMSALTGPTPSQQPPPAIQYPGQYPPLLMPQYPPVSPAQRFPAVPASKGAPASSVSPQSLEDGQFQENLVDQWFKNFYPTDPSRYSPSVQNPFSQQPGQPGSNAARPWYEDILNENDLSLFTQRFGNVQQPTKDQVSEYQKNPFTTDPNIPNKWQQSIVQPYPAVPFLPDMSKEECITTDGELGECQSAEMCGYTNGVVNGQCHQGMVGSAKSRKLCNFCKFLFLKDFVRDSRDSINIY